MSGMLTNFARDIAASAANDHIVHWLRTVPGLPPIVQTVHLVSIACIVASIVMIDLRVLGWALPSQAPREMVSRLAPWMWAALVLLALSGAVFVIARPLRYLQNPVFGFKMACLLPALLLSVLLVRLLQRGERISGAMKSIAGLSLLLWLAVMLAGRWIAYTDYLFPPE